MHSELASMDATAEAELVRRGVASVPELVEAAIARIEALNPALNAVITPLFDKARAAARAPAGRDAPFRGVPLLLKDLDSYSAGDPFHAGMRVLREVGWTAKNDTNMVTKLRAAGFILVGKTNVPELGLLPTTEPEAYGPTRNPWDPSRSPGGSSGGSGAAVAARLVTAAHGSDGGGSIRIPASACGLVGLKPSRGRNSLGPDSGELWAGLVAEHVLTRSVRDTAAILDAVAGLMPGDSYCAPPPLRPFAEEAGVEPGRMRVGLLTRAPGGMTNVHPACATGAETAARLLESLGHVVEPAYPAALDEEDFVRWLGVIVSSWTARALDHWSAVTERPINAKDVEIATWTLAEMGRSVSAAWYIQAVTWLGSFARRVGRWWADGFDVLLTPTLGEPPPPLGQFGGRADDPMVGLLRSTSLAAFTSPFNVTGQPAISLPLHWNEEGLPIGVQLVAAYGREDVLIRIAAQLERAYPWADRVPPLCA